ncbi:hypothetical protein QK290_15595 [Pseudarthrobacter sp. AL07]|uniref:hypothetical protein n=1 Tax=unclassified Pseudarthrobacter TaxID=2647000 RepID=UPI00249B789C|nr:MULTISPECIES: hypothetical protein [unclassified Pseudarthrobacter]MDI3195757.1 hypothetical protein [Pseudarthrobacter sp. AL20]MDI3209891.1 hypothetical protein [Pseudarthrobacter sp. AL07]
MLNTDDDGAPAPDSTEPMEPEAQPAAAAPKRSRKRRILQATTAVVLLAGGVAFGTVLPDPKSSDAYAALADEKGTVEIERDAALSSYASVKGKYDSLQGGITARESKVSARETEVGKADAAVKTAEAAVKAREEAVAGAEKTKAANTIGDGTWTVGSDIEPGTYRAAAAVGSTCYWGIYRSGSNGGDIIDNDLPGGGRPVVTLSPGQDFNSTRCGKWEKQ